MGSELVVYDAAKHSVFTCKAGQAHQWDYRRSFNNDARVSMYVCRLCGLSITKESLQSATN